MELIAGLFLISLILFIREKRSFLTAISITASTLLGIIYLLYNIDEANRFAYDLTLMIVYGILPIAIITISILLIRNTKIMNSKEGRKLASFLSAIIGIDIIMVLVSIVILIVYEHRLNVYIRVIMLMFLLTSIYLGFLFVSYLAYSYFYQKMAVRSKVDYIIVLGSGLIGDRVPPLLKSRLDKGIEIYKQQLSKGNSPKIIVSGGQGSDELVSEASAMRKYLLSQDIANEAILVEDKSTTTYENLKFSKELIDTSKKYSCVISTNNYHVFRAVMYAKDAKLKASGVGAPTAFYFLPSALIREFIAILVINKWTNLLILGLLYIWIISSFVLN